MLDKLDDILLMLVEIAEEETTGNHSGFVSPKSTDHLFCPKCSEVTRMSVRVYDGGKLAPQLMAQKMAPEYLTPGPMRPAGLGNPTENSEPNLLTYHCSSCKTRFAAVVHWGAQGPALSVFPECQSSFSSDHVPPEVSYHLNEAYLAHSIGANTAAIASFWGSAENLLYLQGYTTGMLDAKILAVETNLKAGTGPAWVGRVEPEIMRVIQRLGNKAVHIKKVARLVAFDAALCRRLIIAFKYLVNLIYEEGALNATLLVELQAMNKKVK